MSDDTYTVFWKSTDGILTQSDINLTLDQFCNQFPTHYYDLETLHDYTKLYVFATVDQDTTACLFIDTFKIT